MNSFPRYTGLKPGDKKPHRDKHFVQVSRTTGDIVVGSNNDLPDGWIPAGWIWISENRAVPQWPSCSYRRLNVIISRSEEPPKITPLCIKYDHTGMEVNCQTCMDCKVFETNVKKPRLQFTDEQVEAVFRRDWEVFGDDPTMKSFLETRTDDELEEITSAAYLSVMDDTLQSEPKVFKSGPTETQIRWNPCKFREKRLKTGEDCKGCSDKEISCTNPDAEYFDQVVRRSICKACPVAVAPRLEDYQ
jgi:hypothetical protein